jgi:hypothetical protein
MSITTTEAVDAILQLNHERDEEIAILIPLVEDWIRGVCRDDYAEGFPPGYELIAIRMIGYILSTKPGISSYGIGGYSQSTQWDFPPEVVSGLRRKVVLK